MQSEGLVLAIKAFSQPGTYSLRSSIALTWRNPADLSQVVSPGASDVVHVEVRVFRTGQPALTTGWFVTGGL